MEPRKLVYSGLMRKSPPEEKIEKNYKWRKRHFKLWSDKTLEYYKRKNDLKPLKEPIELNSCLEIIKMKPEYKKYLKQTRYKWGFCLSTPTRSYNLVAISKEEKELWKKHLAAVCNFGPDLRRPVEDIHDIMTDAQQHRDSISSKGSSVSRKSFSTSSSSDPGSAILHRVNQVTTTDGVINNDVDEDDNYNDDDALSSSGSSNEADDTYDTPRPSICSDRTGSLSTVDSSRIDSFASARNESISSNFSDKSKAMPNENDDYLVMTENDVSIPDEEDSSDVYQDMGVVSPINHIKITPEWGSKKQSSTKIRTLFSPNGESYVQMNPVPGSDYIPMDDKKPEPFEKNKKFKQINKSLSLRPKPSPSLAAIPRASTMQIQRTYPAKSEDPYLAAIPDVKNKCINEPPVLAEPVAPDVCRETKPSPSIDRSTKPRLVKQTSYVDWYKRPPLHHTTNLNMSFDTGQFRRAYDESHAYMQHNIMNPSQYDNNTTRRFNDQTDFGDYSNHRLKSHKQDFRNGAVNYCNVDLNELRRLKPNNNNNNYQESVGDLYANFDSCQIEDDNIYEVENIDYKNEELPTPPDIAETFNGISVQGYENVQATPRSPTEGLNYVECQPASHEMTGELGETKTGTHYVMVDTLKSQAVKKLR
ncbi:uncharacterized protein LOC130654333 [Hydractinia symbiolongicarpus]|uniref:uncharacterized protein LOC130654333 n=1 Tax=Hydractinia symbiolongicarpus TaxID=13093 RepID=UPI00254D8886|nr:uncharacterized protein LOC130654333 [Hydractinia symbiolongicarpus]